MRIQAFIDGFNLYHSIDTIAKKDSTKQTYKWLNLRSLMEAFIKPSKETLNEVFYFTAYATWLPDPMRRHKTYIKALEYNNVTTILGNFKKKQMQCRSCGIRWDTREEKQSDVNIGIHLVKNAFQDNFDIALLVTSDSDMIPIINMIHDNFPKKRVIAVIPPNRYNITKEIQAYVEIRKIKEKHLKNNLLPCKILMPDGTTIIKPSKYT